MKQDRYSIPKGGDSAVNSGLTSLYCLTCRWEVILEAGKWVHLDGRGDVMRRCPKCGYETASIPPLKFCPVKHREKDVGYPLDRQVKMIDDHIASPTLNRLNKKRAKRCPRH